jgi:Fe-S-cluster-containing dehydrogenase component
MTMGGGIKHMVKTNIKVNAKECAECLCCQLICSFTYTGSFNPEKAKIIVEPITDPGKERKISFASDCIEGCSLCTRYCVFGAIVRQPSEGIK